MSKKLNEDRKDNDNINFNYFLFATSLHLVLNFIFKIN